MDRRRFFATQAALTFGALFTTLPYSSRLLWAASRRVASNDPYASYDWDRLRVDPVALPALAPDGRLLPFDYPDPINPTWPRQKTPDFARQLRHVSGVRPFRRGGFRLERETLDGGRKILVHNYGHGGAGVTLSWGVAELAVETLGGVDRRMPVAVLGGGIVGLSTAAVLLEKGYRVRVYAQAFHPSVTSSVAGGQFAPSVVEVPAELQMNDVLLRSWRRFAALEELGVGVSYVPNFLTGGGGGFNRFPRGTIPGGRAFRLARLPFDGPLRAGSFAWTLLIETPIYLPWLAQSIQAAGGSFEERTFATSADVVALPESIIINCLGFGAKAVFDDRRLTGVRGQLVLLEPQDLGYLLSYNGGYIFSRKDAVVIGGTFEYGEEREATTPVAQRTILRRGRDFFGVSGGASIQDWRG